MGMTKDLDTRAIAERLKQVRAEHRLSQTEAAALLSVPFRTYQGYEGGERDVSASFLDNLNRAFGVNPIWMLRGEGYKKGVLPQRKIIEILTELLDRWAAEQTPRASRAKAEDFIRVIAFIEANSSHATDQVLELVAPKLALDGTDTEADV